MLKVELIHPKLGVCQTTYIPDHSDLYRTCTKWRKRYGKKFDECEIKFYHTDEKRNVVDEGSIKKGRKKKIISIRDKITDEIYDSYDAAAKATGLSIMTIRLHCRHKIGQGTARGSYKDGIRFSLITPKIEEDEQ